MIKRPIDCEQALRQIFQFIDHELVDDERVAMEQHLHTCKSCFSRTEFERLLKERVGELRDEEVSPHMSQRIGRLLKSF
jgi:anti-sigma factor (TIGR02949 family)